MTGTAPCFRQSQRDRAAFSRLGWSSRSALRNGVEWGDEVQRSS